jgi:hypothetical protein
MAQAKKNTGSGVKQASKAKLLKGGVDPSVGKATQFKPGESGNPDGKPKGTKHIKTWIQELLNDEEFETWLPDRRDGFKEYKGAPAKAIIQAGAIRAMMGDHKWADILFKHGWDARVEVTGADGVPLMPVVRIIDERQSKDT